MFLHLHNYLHSCCTYLLHWLLFYQKIYAALTYALHLYLLSVITKIGHLTHTMSLVDITFQEGNNLCPITPKLLNSVQIYNSFGLYISLFPSGSRHFWRAQDKDWRQPFGHWSGRLEILPGTYFNQYFFITLSANLML